MTAHVQINSERLARRLAEISQFGATPAGGLDRQALTNDEIAARTYVLAAARARGFSCATDAIGNLFIRRDGTDAARDPIVAGSHLDSQPRGGRYDGTLGVVAALEMLESLSDAEIDHRHPIEAVAWTNEEGSRFAPGTMGSQVYAGVADAAAMQAVTDANGISVGAALAEARNAYGPLPARGLALPFSAYLELHIEQGPVLEAKGLKLGVVDGIQGARWFNIQLLGTAGHAGTTPDDMRRDAGAAAIRAASVARGVIDVEADPRMRFTIGRIGFEPGSINTIPASAAFTIDLRHPDTAALDELEQRLRTAMEAVASPCACTVERIMDNPPTRFDPVVLAACEAAAKRQGLPAFQMTSGAFHDAQYAAMIAPAGMLFIPCRDGVSHAEIEDIESDHAAVGTQALMDAVMDLDRTLPNSPA